MKKISNEYLNNIKNVKATFAVEGMNVSSVSIANIKRLANGESSCEEIIREIKRKYFRKA